MIFNVTKSVLGVAVALTIFVGCKPSGHGPDSSDSMAPPIVGPQLQGTVDSGGGNTFMGKPLESYVIQVRKLPAFKEGVESVLESIGLRSLKVKNVFVGIIDKKTWYLIPSELKQLPSDKIASAVGADQAALQDFKQVWINQNIFDKMSVQDQALLIIHEILMGLRLLRFDSALSECQAFLAADEKDSFCKNSYSTVLRGSPSDLSAIDYAQIRATAQKLKELSEVGEKFSPADWNDLLGTQGFSTQDHEFTPNVSVKTIAVHELGQMIQESKLTKSWPNHGFDFNKFLNDHPELLKPGSGLPSMIWRSDRKCDFNIDMTSNSFSISLYDVGGSKVYSTPWTSSIESILQMDRFVGQYYYVVTTPPLKVDPLKLDPPSRQGDEVLFVTLKFLDHYLQGAFLEKAVCLNSTCSEIGASPDAFKMMCYTRSSLQLGSSK